MLPDRTGITRVLYFRPGPPTIPAPPCTSSKKSSKN